MTEIAAALPGAVARGEIHALFQPQVDLRSNRIVAAEALCRWTHPTLGAIGPAVFIALAEQSEAIHEIGRFMAEACFVALARWTARRPMDVSVNVSPVQLHTPAFTEWLTEQLRRHRVREHTYSLEITESRPISDAPVVVRRLDQLRDLGFGVSIDDFGTGQASMRQLRRLHGTELKIDRSLVVDDDPETEEFVRTTVEAAHEAGVRVVAEGVETDVHLERVARLGVDRVQGYLFGRPMPEDDLTALLEMG